VDFLLKPIKRHEFAQKSLKIPSPYPEKRLAQAKSPETFDLRRFNDLDDF